ncbi:MAG: type IV pilus modification protein PilV [Candidatus Muproteobacteria bacterium RBG_16_60_9]|uniref:Type IV pilus modification protein PilV n=1 Tax=Candidatus Muproteobacteria bacterium RBG_16_60_9 TaxID=1817755 RepID=A0A1F6VIQ7_9PROT|nr:MAG: type IV pilus modification protein PilV [Candidatus Muproteobacteria bacterium RBG_16_60_9]
MRIFLGNNRLSGGFTLVEVLVAIVVLSIGLLGLAALQITSLQFNSNSYLRTQATVVAYDLIDRMRSNRAAFAANAYHVPTTSAADTMVTTTYQGCKSSSCDCQGSACSISNLAIYDLGQWYELTDNLLPGSLTNRPTITRNSVTNEATIDIKWTEKDVQQSKSWTVRL